MRLSLFTVLDAADATPGAPARDRWSEFLELGAAAEVAGLASVWVAEHHFQEAGLCPAPPVLLAALAARTRRIRLGPLVSVLPFHAAIEVAEQYALVDRVSGGRLNLGVGSGYIPVEFEGFGVDPATKRERFDRALATVLAAWRGEEVRGDGPGARPVRINVRPVQQPHPPLWVAVQRREAIPFVARRGAGLALVPYATLAGLDELREEVREYRAALPAGTPGSVGAAFHVYAGSRPDRARAALQRYLDSRLATQSTFFRAKVERDPHLASVRALEEAGFAAIGAPRDVASHLRGFGKLGLDEVLGIFDFGGLPPDDAVASVRALGEAFGPSTP